MKVTYCIISVLLFTLLSCVKEVQLQLDEYPQKVVVNSLFCPDSLLRVHVSLSKSPKVSGSYLLQEYDDIDFVVNAVVKLYKDGQFLQDLIYSQNGWYNSFHIPLEGSKYKIEVTVAGFDMVWAESAVPHYPEITQQPICKYIGPAVVEDIEYIARETQIFFKDSLGEDFYGFYGYLDSWNFIDRNKITDPSLLADNDFNRMWGFFHNIIFRDVLFDGQIKKVAFIGIGFGVNNISTGYDLRFGSISKEYFQYLDALYKHLANANPGSQLDDPISLLFMGNPIETYSNINGGLGIFAAYNYKLLHIIYVD
jgi:hypothetical protein